MGERELMKELRKLAKQNLIDRDWWDINDTDITNEMLEIVENDIKGKIDE